jgi:hypothetical protein
MLIDLNFSELKKSRLLRYFMTYDYDRHFLNAYMKFKFKHICKENNHSELLTQYQTWDKISEELVSEFK